MVVQRLSWTLALLTLVLVGSAPGDIAAQGRPQIDLNAAYDCCNIASGQIVGKMTIMQCAQRPGHSPKIPGDPNAERLCKAAPTPTGGGGGGGGYQDRPVWTTFKPNLPNGSFEEWSGPKPARFGTYSKPEGRQVEGLRDFETAFRSSEAIEGGSALLLRNFKPDVEEWVRGRPIPAMAIAIMEKIVFPAGVVSCKPNCPISAGPSAGRGNLEDTTFPIEGVGDALCGAFKSRLVGGDTLSVSLVLRSGRQPVGGATVTDILQARLSREASGWTKFRIPIAMMPGREGVVADSGVLQLQILPGGGGMSAGGQVSQGSEVLIDAVHLCGGVDLQIADAVSQGGRIVPEDKEEIGAIASVNFDNDDGDKTFDYRDEDGVTGGDNDLAQLVLQLPSEARGTVELRQTGGEGLVKVWTANTKRPADTYGDLGRRLAIAEARFTDNGAFLEKVLWIEGLKGSAATSDVTFELIVIPEGGSERTADTDKVALTVLTVKDMIWRGKESNSEFDDNTLTPDPNHPLFVRGGGSSDPDYDKPVRVFPDKRYVGGVPTGGRRDKVELEVTLNVKPPRKVEVHLRAFDLDDPTAHNDEVDDIDKADDNRGATVAGTGVFTESGTDQFSLEFEEAVAKAEFQVTMQPGDNFRIAAGFDKAYLLKLANDDTRLGRDWRNGARIVDRPMFDLGVPPVEAELPEPGSWLSDTLTVWRFLHVERDSMEAVSGETLRGTVLSITAGGSHQNRPVWLVVTDLNITSARSPSEDRTKGHFDSFLNGQMRIAGMPFYVLGNTAHGFGGDTFKVVDSGLDDATFRDSLIGKRFEVEDDDRRQINIAGAPGQAGPFTDGSPIPLPPDDRLRISDDNPYLKAYVYPRIDTLQSGPGSRPFVGNLRTDRDVEYIRSFYAGFDKAAYEDDPDLWTVYLLGAFQGVKWEDADGLLTENGATVGAVAGEADGPGGTGALIYWSSGAELEKQHQSAPGWRLIDAVVHEIGHLFGCDHPDGGLMSDGNYGPPTDMFSAKSLAKIRSAIHP